MERIERFARGKSVITLLVAANLIAIGLLVWAVCAWRV